MTIEKLEALAARFADTPLSDEHLYEVRGDVVNALPSLLKVRKAAKTYCVLSNAGAYADDAYLDLWKALEELEAK